MKRLEVTPPGLGVETWCGDESIEPLGVAVEFHPGIPRVMRGIVLEATLRHWKREVGTVTRAGAVEPSETGVWLRGWTVQPFQEPPVVGMRIAYRHSADDEEMTA